MNTKTNTTHEREVALCCAALFLQDYKAMRRQAERLKEARTLRAAYRYNEVSSAEYDRLTKELQLAEEAFRKSEENLAQSEARLECKLNSISVKDIKELKSGGDDNEN